VVVPDLRGMTLDQARARIAGRLSLGQVNKRAAPRAAPGTVIEQSPAGGTQAAQASRVDVVVAANVATVPALVGRDYGDALGVLRANDLAVGRVDRRLAERQAPGSVIDQHPRAGTFVDPGSSVSLVIAEQGVRVPEVTNLLQDEAVSRLVRAGLSHTISLQRTDRFKPGTVIRQSVAAGQVVGRGALVALTIAERAPECVVPNVIGNYRQAVEMLQRQGFRVTTQGPSERSASVVGQMPAAGTRTACGATVTVITRSASIEQDPTGGSPPTRRIIDLFRPVDPGMQIRPPPERVD
jgi:serine/threonine-protein kinase